MVREATTAAACARWIREIHGDESIDAAGVLHVASVCCDPSGIWRSLQIVDETPQSATDRFLLATARARADAIVTSGRILRREPGLCHALEGGGPIGGLPAWRTGLRGSGRAATSVVLRRRADLDLSHPLFTGGRAVIVCSREVASALQARYQSEEQAAPLEIVARARPGLRDTLEWLRAERGAETILVETGPATNALLYDEPVAIDELLLSIYRGPAPAARVVGAAFVPKRRIDEVFPPGTSLRTEYESQEESGPWSFHRFRRHAKP